MSAVMSAVMRCCQEGGEQKCEQGGRWVRQFKIGFDSPPCVDTSVSPVIGASQLRGSVPVHNRRLSTLAIDHALRMRCGPGWPNLAPSSRA